MLSKTLLLAFAVVLIAPAQNPKVGTVEIFGLRKVPAEKVRKALGVLELGQLPPSKAEAEERIEAVDGILRASLEAVCCEQGRAILYVGVQERGFPTIEFRDNPTTELNLPEEITAEWHDFITAVGIAARAANTAEDLSRGYSLMADEGPRKSQLRFIEFAEKHYALLREILRNAEDEQQRGIAAYVIGYSAKKKEAALELQYAMRDPSPTVRSNAMRALSAIAVFAGRDKESSVKVAPTWFVEMLNSIHFSDRTKASVALVNLTETRDSNALEHIREKAISALTEMSGWRSLDHALPAFILLGRVVGLPEDQIQELWRNGGREQLLQKLKESGKRTN